MALLGLGVTLAFVLCPIPLRMIESRIREGSWIAFLR